MVDSWHNKSVEDTLLQLEVTKSGLTSEEVNSRRLEYGENKLKDPVQTPGWLRFLSQYNDPLNYLLIGAALVALTIHPDQPGDAIFIFIVLTANAYFGYWQEGQAEQAMDSLKKMSISQCVVVRDSIDVEVQTTDLVPGDIVNLYEGLRF